MYVGKSDNMLLPRVILRLGHIVSQVSNLSTIGSPKDLDLRETRRGRLGSKKEVTNFTSSKKNNLGSTVMQILIMPIYSRLYNEP